MTDYLYQVGGSLTSEAPSYVEREADAQLYEALKQGEFCYVLNSRQMGKSSLLVRTKHRLEQEGFKCTSVDLTNIGSENITPTQWYKGVVADLWSGFKLLGKLNLKTWWRDQEDISLLQRLSWFISELLEVQFPGERLFIFLDEIDSILSLDFSVDDFFALIRFCYNQRAIDPAYERITFAIFGVATPSDLITDKNRTPFNIGKAIELAGFEDHKAQALAKGLELENAQLILKEIIAWTGGQPFLTQKLCKILQNLSQNSQSEALVIPTGTEAGWVESLVRSRLIQQWESQDEPEHLKTVRDRLLRNEQRAGKLLGIYQQILQSTEVSQSVPTDDSREQIELLLSGLVVKQDGFLKVKNPIYQEVFNLEWVEKQLNSLRPYSQALLAWVDSQQADSSRLLRGQALKDAQIWAQGKSLSDLDYQFIAASQECDRQEVERRLEAQRVQEVENRLTQEQKRLGLQAKTGIRQKVILSIVSIFFLLTCTLAGATYFQYIQVLESEHHAKLSAIQALATSSQGLFASNRKLDALVAALQAKERLQALGPFANLETEAKVKKVLRQAVVGANEFNRFSRHRDGFAGVDFSKGGKLIAAASNGKIVKIWQRDGTLLHTLSHDVVVEGVKFSPNGNLLVTSTLDGALSLWKVDGTLLRTLEGPSGEVAALSPESQAIATVGTGNAPQALTLDTPKGHSAINWRVAFSPDGDFLALAKGDDTIELWKPDGTLLRTIQSDNDVFWSVAISPNSQTIASASRNSDIIKLWDKNGTLLRNIQGNSSGFTKVAFISGGQAIAAASLNGTVYLWKLDGTLLTTLAEYSATLLGAAISPNYQPIIKTGNGKSVIFWDVQQILQLDLQNNSLKAPPVHNQA